MSRKALQAVNLILALGTTGLAGMSLLFGAGSPVYGTTSVPESAALDSNLRFMGGLGLGLGLALVWITPAIERHTAIFRLVWLCALLGGIGRLVSLAVTGTPPLPMIVFAAIEVPGVPALIYWQSAVSARMRMNGADPARTGKISR